MSSTEQFGYTEYGSTEYGGATSVSESASVATTTSTTTTDVGRSRSNPTVSTKSSSFSVEFSQSIESVIGTAGSDKVAISQSRSIESVDHTYKSSILHLTEESVSDEIGFVATGSISHIYTDNGSSIEQPSIFGHLQQLSVETTASSVEIVTETSVIRSNVLEASDASQSEETSLTVDGSFSANVPSTAFASDSAHGIFRGFFDIFDKTESQSTVDTVSFHDHLDLSESTYAIESPEVDKSSTTQTISKTAATESSTTNIGVFGLDHLEATTVATSGQLGISVDRPIVKQLVEHGSATESLIDLNSAITSSINDGSSIREASTSVYDSITSGTDNTTSSELLSSSVSTGSTSTTASSSTSDSSVVSSQTTDYLLETATSVEHSSVFGSNVTQSVLTESLAIELATETSVGTPRVLEASDASMSEETSLTVDGSFTANVPSTATAISTINTQFPSKFNTSETGSGILYTGGVTRTPTVALDDDSSINILTSTTNVATIDANDSTSGVESITVLGESISIGDISTQSIAIDDSFRPITSTPSIPEIGEYSTSTEQPILDGGYDSVVIGSSGANERSQLETTNFFAVNDFSRAHTGARQITAKNETILVETSNSIESVEINTGYTSLSTDYAGSVDQISVHGTLFDSTSIPSIALSIERATDVSVINPRILESSDASLSEETSLTIDGSFTANVPTTGIGNATSKLTSSPLFELTSISGANEDLSDIVTNSTSTTLEYGFSTESMVATTQSGISGTSNTLSTELIDTWGVSHITSVSTTGVSVEWTDSVSVVGPRVLESSDASQSEETSLTVDGSFSTNVPSKAYAVSDATSIFSTILGSTGSSISNSTTTGLSILDEITSKEITNAVESVKTTTNYTSDNSETGISNEIVDTFGSSIGFGLIQNIAESFEVAIETSVGTPRVLEASDASQSEETSLTVDGSFTANVPTTGTGDSFSTLNIFSGIIGSDTTTSNDILTDISVTDEIGFNESTSSFDRSTAEFKSDQTAYSTSVSTDSAKGSNHAIFRSGDISSALESGDTQTESHVSPTTELGTAIDSPLLVSKSTIFGSDSILRGIGAVLSVQTQQDISDKSFAEDSVDTDFESLIDFTDVGSVLTNAEIIGKPVFDSNSKSFSTEEGAIVRSYELELFDSAPIVDTVSTAISDDVSTVEIASSISNISVTTNQFPIVADTGLAQTDLQIDPVLPGVELKNDLSASIESGHTHSTRLVNSDETASGYESTDVSANYAITNDEFGYSGESGSLIDNAHIDSTDSTIGIGRAIQTNSSVQQSTSIAGGSERGELLSPQIFGDIPSLTSAIDTGTVVTADTSNATDISKSVESPLSTTNKTITGTDYASSTEQGVSSNTHTVLGSDTALSIENITTIGNGTNSIRSIASAVDVASSIYVAGQKIIVSSDGSVYELLSNQHESTFSISDSGPSTISANQISGSITESVDYSESTDVGSVSHGKSTAIGLDTAKSIEFSNIEQSLITDLPERSQSIEHGSTSSTSIQDLSVTLPINESPTVVRSAKSLLHSSNTTSIEKVDATLDSILLSTSFGSSSSVVQMSNTVLDNAVVEIPFASSEISKSINTTVESNDTSIGFESGNVSRGITFVVESIVPGLQNSVSITNALRNIIGTDRQWPRQVSIKYDGFHEIAVENADREVTINNSGTNDVVLLNTDRSVEIE